jgi:hypothetical protein
MISLEKFNSIFNSYYFSLCDFQKQTWFESQMLSQTRDTTRNTRNSSWCKQGSCVGSAYLVYI